MGKVIQFGAPRKPDGSPDFRAIANAEVLAQTVLRRFELGCSIQQLARRHHVGYLWIEAQIRNRRRMAA